MARDFDGSVDYATGASPAPSALQIVGDISVVGTVTWDSVAAGFACLVACGESDGGDTEDKNHTFFVGRTGAALVCFHENGAGVNNIITLPLGTFTISIGVEYKIAYIRDATAKTYRFIVDEVDHGTVGYANNPTGGSLGYIRIGAANDSTAVQKTDGRISEVGVFDAALSSSSAMQYTKSSLDMRMVSPANLVEGWHLYGNNSPETSIKGTDDLTLTGTTKFAHPRVIQPSAQILQFPVVAVGGATIPILRRRIEGY